MEPIQLRSINVDLLQQRLAATRPGEPLNRRLYDCLRGAILDGALPAGSRLPPTRDLAAELGVSRNTAIHAYEQLLTEGYVRALTGSGTFVAEQLPDAPQLRAAADAARFPAEAIEAGELSPRGRQVLDGARAAPTQWGAFMPGVPDVTRFPHQRIARITARLSRTLEPGTLSYAAGGGHQGLQRSLAAYLRQARSVECEPEQIIITEGVHQAIDLIARILGSPGDVAWVEEPGYWGIRSVLTVNGLRLHPMRVDADGMEVPAAASGEGVGAEAVTPRFVFITPSHQYPLGSVMSMARRFALIEYARASGAWIVEDDYDGEFRFSGQPVPSLQGLQPGARVIYVGTFSKTLYPGLRTAYMVVPKALAPAFRTAQSELYRGGHTLMQAALAEFIDEGYYAAHIRKMRLIYAARRAFLLGLVKNWLGAQWLHGYDSNAGLHLVLNLPEAANDQRIARLAEERGVLVRPLSQYYMGRQRGNGLLLGFASIPQEQMLEPFERLVQCIRECT